MKVIYIYCNALPSFTSLFPSLSTIDSILIILLSNIDNVKNCSGVPTSNTWVFLSADIAFACFFNKKYSGLLLASN